MPIQSNSGGQDPRPPNPDDEGPVCEPVGSGDVNVGQGDCALSIAHAHGLSLKTLWEHGDNAQIKEARQTPHVLLPNDRLTIPEVQPRSESGASEQRHRFVRLNSPTLFRVRLRRAGKPLQNCEYEFHVDGRLVKCDTTDAEGMVEQEIEPTTARVQLVVTHNQRERLYDFRLGGLDPIDACSGIQGRLLNLGFYSGDVNGRWNDATRAAVRSFQSHVGLEPSGVWNDETRDSLKEEYGV